MSGIKEILKEKYPWMIYIVLFVIVFVLFLLFNRFNLFQTNPDSARYMLSALVQSEAAIVAIVITLSLVAVQLTASSYSPRVTEIFRKAPDLWILMISYIVAIIYGLGVLKLIEATLELNLEFWIRIACFSGIYCFVALLPYIYNVFEMLKPSTIIKELSRNITKENLLLGGTIQSIFDIVRGSIMKYDYETAREGLKAITEKMCEIFQKYKLNQDEEENISEIIGEFFYRTGKLAIDKRDEESISEIIYYFEITNIAAIEKGYKRISEEMATRLNKIETVAIDKKLGLAATWIADSFGKIGKAAAEQGLEDTACWVMRYLEENANVTIKIGFMDVSLWTINSLGEIGVAAAESELEKTTIEANRHLTNIGKIVIKNRLEKHTWRVVHILGEVGVASAEMGMDESADFVKKSLMVIKKICKNRIFRDSVLSIEGSLSRIEDAKRDYEKS